MISLLLCSYLQSSEYTRMRFIRVVRGIARSLDVGKLSEESGIYNSMPIFILLSNPTSACGVILQVKTCKGSKIVLTNL